MNKAKLQVILAFGLVLGLTIALAPIGVSAVEYTAIQLTDNDYYDGFGGVSNGYITWVGGEGADSEIFLYDASTKTITQITNNDFVDTIPAVHDGKVTWVAYPPDGTDGEVYLYDHNGDGVPTRITNDDLEANYPQIHDGLITWYGWEGSVTSAQIYVYDSNSESPETIQVSDGSIANYWPKVHNGMITWHGTVGAGGPEIFLYDYYSSEGVIRITEDATPDTFPQIHEGLVAWRNNTDEGVKIYLYDSADGTTTFVGNMIYSYGFSLHDGQIAYVAPEDPENPDSDFEIFLYDYFGNARTQITFNDYDDFVSHLYAGKVVWTVSGNIFLYDSATGVTDQVTASAVYDESPLLTSGFLAWMGRGGTTGSDYEIYIAGLASSSDVDFDPNTLNLDSKGRWVTVYIELPVDHEYAADAIDVSTVLLNGLIPAETNPSTIGDYDADGIIDLMVKFDRSAVQAILDVGEEVTVTITGMLPDGSQFEGTDIIRVICNP